MRTLVIGDIHGGYKGLKQIFEQCKLDYDNDRVISLGDIVDGWSESFECVEELLKIKNLIAIKGNHDYTFMQYVETNDHPWGFGHGAKETYESYCKNIGKQDYTELKLEDIPESHINFFKNQINYYVDNKRLFVHGGFNRHFPITDELHNHEDILLWDRDMFKVAMLSKKIISKDGFSEIYIGHSPTLEWNSEGIIRAGNVYNLDTGAAYTGKLSIMDIDTKEIWQSDYLKDLYPNEKGRNT